MASAFIIGTALALAGCSTLHADGGLAGVARLTQQRVGQAPVDQRSPAQAEAAERRAAALMTQPLTADSAVELALLHHRGLQAALAELGVADADRVRAGRLPNPAWRFGRLNGGGSTEIDRAVMLDVLAALTLPWRREAGQGQFEQAQLQAAQAAIGVATQARLAYFEAVAAHQVARHFAQVLQAAEASSELARRMQAAGNFSKLAQMREQAFHAEAVAEAVRADQRAGAARERLARALALPGGPGALKLPDRLPDLPATLPESREVEQAAIDQRLDVLLARRQAEATAQALGLTRATRFVNVLHAGFQNQSATGEAPRRGVELELELPLFDFGSTRAARAEAVYLQALHHTAQVALDARSEVREAWAAWRSSHALARHYRDEVVPLRQRISEENLLRYNGMLASVFDLLADTREQIISVAAAVDAQRDHWLAETRLQAAMAGVPAGASSATPTARAAAAVAGGAH